MKPTRTLTNLMINHRGPKEGAKAARAGRTTPPRQPEMRNSRDIAASTKYCAAIGDISQKIASATLRVKIIKATNM